MIADAFFFLLNAAFSIVFIAGSLWAAMRIVGAPGDFADAALAAAACWCGALVPVIGWPLSVVLLFVVLEKRTQMEIWPDLIFTAIVGRVVAVLVAVGLMIALPPEEEPPDPEMLRLLNPHLEEEDIQRILDEH